jgi:uncharacterized protein (DUF1330 family)
LAITQNKTTIDMIHLIQLIYVIEGQEEIFHQFEDVAIPAISKYNGRLTLRIRPTDNCIIVNNIEKPYEIHLVEFDTQEDFDNFKKDEERKKFLHLKEQSIRASILIQGSKL